MTTPQYALGRRDPYRDTRAEGQPSACAECGGRLTFTTDGNGGLRSTCPRCAHPHASVFNAPLPFRVKLCTLDYRVHRGAEGRPMIGVRVDAAEQQWLRAEADRRGCTMSTLVRAVLREWREEVARGQS